MAEFRMPSLGADMEAGELVEWLVKPGDPVRRGQVVCVVETMKGAIDVEIWQDGVIAEIVVGPGEKVPVGTVLARLTGAEETVVTSLATGELDAPRDDRPRMSPRARKRARELALDASELASVPGSGPGGVITGEDVERAAGAEASRGPSKDPALEMRRAIAVAMSRSNREIPHYYLAHTIDLERTMQWLEQQNAQRSITQRLLPIVPVLKAIALALKEVPELDGWWRHDQFEPAEHVDLGIAISLRGGGLVAPPISAAEGATLDSIMASLSDLVTRARAGQLRSSEIAGGSVTVTNLGDRGVESVFGVIYPPQVALVGCGKIVERPWVVEGNVQVRRVITLSLAADHRASDGHRGGVFIDAVARLVQRPEEL